MHCSLLTVCLGAVVFQVYTYGIILMVLRYRVVIIWQQHHDSLSCYQALFILIPVSSVPISGHEIVLPGGGDRRLTANLAASRFSNRCAEILFFDFWLLSCASL